MWEEVGRPEVLEGEGKSEPGGREGEREKGRKEKAPGRKGGAVSLCQQQV